MKEFTFRPFASEAPQWHYAFLRFADGISDWRPVLEQIADDFKKGEIQQFATEGQYGSGGWKALSPKYAVWKEAQKPGAPVLVFSGLLRRAATNPEVVVTKDRLTITIDDSGSYQVFSKREGRLVTKHKPAVAGYHQEGKGNLPVRKVIQLPESQIVRWRKMFQSYMVAQHRGGAIRV